MPRLVKKALLLLQFEHYMRRKAREIKPAILENQDQIQKLRVESREYQYNQIEHVTFTVARILETIARQPSHGQWHCSQCCYENQLERATLYRCLVSPSRTLSILHISIAKYLRLEYTKGMQS